MRDPAQDAAEMARRRELLLDTGFRLFSERSIESVKLTEVAAASGVGVATLYRYFSTKLAFVVAIGAKKWAEYYDEVEAEYARRGGALMNAAEELEFYLGSYIVLYREHRDILRFNQNFNGYVLHEAAADELLGEYRAAIAPFARKFHLLYEKGARDGTIRTDEPEQTMFRTTMHIMLAVCGRFAQGVVVRGEPEDLTRELLVLKRMILREYVVG